MERNRTDSEIQCVFFIAIRFHVMTYIIFSAAGLGGIRVLMLPIRVPFRAKNMVRIHSVIYPFFYGDFVGRLLVLCLVYC